MKVESMITSLKDNCKYVIYGADAYGEIALAGLRANVVDPEYILDRKLAGKELLGAKILPPQK